ncbi:MAG: DHHA1 domain-containing protein [Desulfomicrobium escambiense]|nr:DHHA1 domain-containing protein [Desulfomicrobium escambiense]
MLTTAARLVEAGAEPPSHCGRSVRLLDGRQVQAFHRGPGDARNPGRRRLHDGHAGDAQEDENIRVGCGNLRLLPPKFSGMSRQRYSSEMDDGACKVSLRSKNAVNVAKIAETLGGGGHKNAAGCKSQG